VTLNLTISNQINTSQSAQICSGSSYILPDGSSVSSEGIYPITLQTSSGCDSVITTTVTFVDQINTSQSAQICSGSSYVLPDGSSVSFEGIYPITLQTSSGCDSIVTTSITIILIPSINQNAQICAGLFFSLPDGSIVNISDTYVTTIASVQGCDSTITTVLTVIDAPTFTQQINICEGGFLKLPDGTVVSSSGTYESTIQTDNGCDSLLITNLFVQPQINDTINVTICQDDSYILPNGNSVNTAGEYIFNEIGITGCDSIVHYILEIQLEPSISVSSDTSICYGQTLTLSAIGANQYTWIPSDASQTLSGNSIIIQPDSTVQYIINATLGSCSITDSVLVTVNPSPNITISPNQITICQGDSIQLLASGSNSFNWTPNSFITCDTCANPIAFPDSTQSYIVTGNIGNCADTAAVSIQVIEPIVVTISGDTSLCFGDSLTLIASGGQSYIWSTNDSTSQITISPTQTGIITVIANSGFCTDTSSFNYNVWPSPFISAGDDTTIHFGGSAQINALTLNQVYWSPSNGLSCSDCPNPIARPLVPTTYCAFVTNSFGCQASDCVKINVDTICPNLFIPNVFSPAAGGNSENDCFKLFGADCIKSMELTIFNRWGEKVFISTNINDCWDGTFKGKDVNTGVFIYYLNAKLIDGEELNKQGNVTLLR